MNDETRQTPERADADPPVGSASAVDAVTPAVPAAPVAPVEPPPPAPARVPPRSPKAAIEPQKVPPPRRHSARARSPIIVAGSAFFTILLVVLLAGAFGLAFGKQRMEEAGPLAADKIVNIARGLGVREIADVLEREGVVRESWLFIGGVLALNAREQMKAGEYQFPRQASVRQVIDTIAEGKMIQHSVTIPEGLTSEQIVARLMENELLSGTIREIPREGSIAPDTIRVTRGTPRDQIVQRLQQQQTRLVQDIWSRRAADLPISTPEQLVTLASIVEKETAKADERARVASVFVNRLNRRMKLQSDPTIIYGLVGGKGSLGRPISRADIDQPTAYNTYTIDGLPPGPIANPGRAALEATANPARTRDLFFVADGTGGHTFSETYEQHQRAVARWREIERGAAPGAAPATPPRPGAPASAAAPRPPQQSPTRQQ
jgi:UPF0755 protein